jgi:ABC-2 type transport system permease protein
VAAQLVRLKLTLLANTFRRSVWQTIGLVLAAAYGMAVTVVVVAGAILGGTADPVLTGQLLTLGGAVAMLAWWVIPLFAFGLDATLDPQRFVTFAIPRRRLLAGLALAGLVSVPAAVTTLAALGVSLAWWSDPLALVGALLGAVLGVGLCIVGSRATTTALAPLLDSRRYREVLMVVAVVPLVLIGPAFGWLSANVEKTVDGAAVQVEVGATSSEAMSGAIAPLVDVVAWTPCGAPWAVGAAVHDGAWGLAVARVAVAAAVLLLAWVVWDRSLARALVTPRGGAAAGVGKGLGWFSRLPATPTGAVAARCATYWVRDPRYAASIAIVPLLPLVLLAVGTTTGAGGGMLLVAAPLVAWILGFGISNDVGYDNTAFALHVATGVRGRADRWGRVLPVLVAGLPLVVALAVVGCAVADRWDALPALLGVSCGTLATSLGVSSAASARLVYPVPKPGESPFKTPQGATVATMVAQMAAMGINLALSIPVLALALPAILVPLPALGWAALAVGVAVGVGALVVGVRWGARVMDRRRPELLQQVMAFR